MCSPRRSALVVLAVCAMLSMTQTSAADSRRFDVASFNTILQEQTGQPFMLTLWSLDCPHCFEELSVLAEYSRRYAGLRLVLVNVDGWDARGDIEKVLADYSFARVDSWIFEQAERRDLRYAIDPAWRGELPRNYWFDSARKRRAFSGKPGRDMLDSWLGESRR